MSAATNPCTGCRHAARPLPSDWTKLDFFDRPVVAQEAVFRTTCTATPDADKPCLKPAPAAAQAVRHAPESMLVDLDTRRQELCLEIAWEVEHIARALPGLVPTNDSGDNAPHFLARALGGRLLRLSNALSCALGDESEDTARLECVINFENGMG